MLNDISDIAVIFLVGFVIKFVDNVLDEGDISHTYLFQLFGVSSYIYSLVVLMVACAINLKLTLVLFFACYSIGMFDSLSMTLPSAIPSWGEIIIAIAFSLLIAGIPLTVWALLIVASIQIIDDLMDKKLDLKLGHFNLAFFLGVERATLLFLILFYISLLFQPLLSVFVFCSALLISEIMSRRDLNA